MIIQTDKIALQTLATNIKNGAILKCEKVEDAFNFTIEEAENANIENACKAKTFKDGFEELLVMHSDKTKKEIVQFQLDDSIEQILNNNFSLRIGSRLLNVGNINTATKSDMKIFEGYYFNISNGVLTTDGTSNSLVEGLQNIINQAHAKYGEIEA